MKIQVGKTYAPPRGPIKMRVDNIDGDAVTYTHVGTLQTGVVKTVPLAEFETKAHHEVA